MKKKVKVNKTEKILETKQEEKKNIKKQFVQFANNPTPIFLVLILWIVVLMVYCYSLQKANKMFVGSISDKEIAVNNIHCFVNNDMNYFHASSALFTGKDQTIYAYNIGYYVESNGELIQFATKSGNFEKGQSLATTVTELSSWSFGETSYQRSLFTKEVVDNIDKLHFVISASTKPDSQVEDVYYDAPVTISKITK